MKGQSDIQFILDRLWPSKRLTSAKSVRRYAWRYRTAHQFSPSPDERVGIDVKT